LNGSIHRLETEFLTNHLFEAGYLGEDSGS